MEEEWRERIHGKTAGIEEHCRNGMETKCRRNFLEPMTVTLVRTLVMEDSESELTIFCNLAKLPVVDWVSFKIDFKLKVYTMF